MSQQTIGLGSAANDGTGDDLRTAGGKINSNFSELYVSAAAAAALLASLSTVAFSGAYADLSGKPSLATVATTGAYADLTGKPTLFDGAFSSLTGKPTTLAGYGISDAQGLDADLTAIAALTTASYGRSLLTLADAAAGRTSLGVVIGTNVQAYNANLASLAGLTLAADKLPYGTGAATLALTDLSAYGRSLIDDADASAARTTLGLGTAAVAATGTSGAALGFLNGTNVWSGIQTITMASGAGPDLEVSITGDTNSRIAIGVNTADVARLSFGPGNAVRNLFLEWAGAGNLRHGAPDAASPVAQIISVQNVVAGTADTAGADLTLRGSQSTGTGIAGNILLQTAGSAASTASTQNALATIATFGPSTLRGGQTTPVLSLVQTWNAGTSTPTALKVNVTDTASGTASLLVDFQVGGSSKLSISKAGAITGPSGATFNIGANGANNLSLAGATVSTSGGLSLNGGSILGRNGAASLYLPSSGQMGFGSSSDNTGTNDTSFTRSAAGIFTTQSSLILLNATAIPAGGTAGAGLKFSTTSNFGVFFGSGAPALAAAKGSIYLRSDGSGTSDRMYVNTDGNTTWTAAATAA